jgi:hypothetical protein
MHQTARETHDGLDSLAALQLPYFRIRGDAKAGRLEG